MSPEPHFGKLWDNACSDVWYIGNRPMGSIQKVWTVAMVILLMACANFCIVITVKKWLRARKVSFEEDERLQTIEETREM